jgi:hypothetical protein
VCQLPLLSSFCFVSFVVVDKIIIQSLVQMSSFQSISSIGSHPSHCVFGDRNNSSPGLACALSKNSKTGPPSFTRLRVRFVAVLLTFMIALPMAGPGTAAASSILLPVLRRC